MKKIFLTIALVFVVFGGLFGLTSCGNDETKLNEYETLIYEKAKDSPGTKIRDAYEYENFIVFETTKSSNFYFIIIESFDYSLFGVNYSFEKGFFCSTADTSNKKASAASYYCLSKCRDSSGKEISVSNINKAIEKYQKDKGWD